MNVGIVGGGYAGRMAAAHLTVAGHHTTLMDPFEHWVERTRLHEAATSGRSVSKPHRRLVDALSARFHKGRVVAIDGGRVHIDDGTALDFDRVVVAAGSVPRRDAPGVRRHALALGDPKEAAAIRSRLAPLPKGATVVVVGAGATGQELATEVAESHPHLRVVLLGDPMADLSSRGRRVVRRALEALRIEVRQARVSEVHPWGVETDLGALEASLVLWAAGMKAPDWLRAAGMPVDPQGQLEVDGALRVVGRPHLVAAGDCAASGLRMSCATAMPLGCHAANTLIREANGLEPEPFRFAFTLRCVSLGRRRGLVQLTRSDDAPKRTAFGGRPAVGVKEAILYGTVHMARWEARTGIPLYRWPMAHVPRGLPTPPQPA